MTHDGGRGGEGGICNALFVISAPRPASETDGTEPPCHSHTLLGMISSGVPWPYVEILLRPWNCTTLHEDRLNG